MSSKADGSFLPTLKQSEQPFASYSTDYESAQVKLICSWSNNSLRKLLRSLSVGQKDPSAFEPHL